MRTAAALSLGCPSPVDVFTRAVNVRSAASTTGFEISLRGDALPLRTSIGPYASRQRVMSSRFHGIAQIDAGRDRSIAVSCSSSIQTARTGRPATVTRERSVASPIVAAPLLSRRSFFSCWVSASVRPGGRLSTFRRPGTNATPTPPVASRHSHANPARRASSSRPCASRKKRSTATPTYDSVRKSSKPSPGSTTSRL